MRMNTEWSAPSSVVNSSPEKRSKTPCFYSNEDGSFTIFSLFLLLLMLMITGMAVDIMRTETQRSRLQSTLDRAVLAAASLEQTLDSKAVVEDYFESAGLSDHLVGVKVTPGATSKTVSAFAHTNVTSSFMKLLGIHSLPALAGGEAEESFTDIEVSLVVDISGSMGWDSSVTGHAKILDLAQAAKDFVYLVQCNPDELTPGYTKPCTIDADTVSISLVPYMEQVNVGQDLLDEFSITNEHSNSNCAEFSHADFFNSDISLTNSLRRSSHTDAYSEVSYGYNTTYAPWIGCRTDSASEIVPLSNDWADLQLRIDALVPYGNTSIDVGMKWGTALLDPAFRPVTSRMSGPLKPTVAFANRPVNYSVKSMQKVIVLMTDGVNTEEHRLKDEYRSGPSEFWFDTASNTLSVYRASTGKYKNTSDGHWYNNPVGANPVQMSFPEVWAKYHLDYYASFPGLKWPANKAGNENKNSNLVAMCAAAKNQGIDVYTLGFETTGSSSAVMKKCATTHSHHFDVDGNSVADAFASIARDIHQLRLTN